MEDELGTLQLIKIQDTMNHNTKKILAASALIPSLMLGTASVGATKVHRVHAQESSEYDSENPAFGANSDRDLGVLLQQEKNQKLDDASEDIFFNEHIQLHTPSAESNTIITQEDWSLLSLKEIDAKLIKAGEEPLFGEEHVFYNMTVEDMENLSQKELDKLVERSEYVELQK